VGFQKPARSRDLRRSAFPATEHDRERVATPLYLIFDRLLSWLTLLGRTSSSRDVATLIVWGGRDPMIPVEHGRHAASLMPGSRFELFEQAGHFPHGDEPARFTDLLLTFLGRTAPARIDAGAFAARVAEHAAHDAVQTRE
jgi:pimeloyl-ACP methyl ester carboxylesterase